MDTIQLQSIEQNLRKLAETDDFSDIYKQDYKEILTKLMSIFISTERHTAHKISHQLIYLVCWTSKLSY